MKSCVFGVLALFVGVASKKEEVPEWAEDATSFAVNVSVGVTLPECLNKDGKEIGANASFAVDADEEYVNFAVSLTKGVKTAEETIWAMVPPPGDDADLPDGVDSKEDLWDMLGLDGKESLTLKARITKEHFSVAVILENAPAVPFFKDGKTLCIMESMEKVGRDAADAFESMPGGFGLHDGEQHPHKDEKNFEKEMKGIMPKDKKAAEKALTAEVKKDVKKGGDDKIEGDDTYTVDTGDMLEQVKGKFDEVPQDAKSPFDVEVFTNQTTGKPTNVLLTGKEDPVKGARIWVNFTKLTTKDVTTFDEPVCKDGQSVDEAVQALMPKPERRLFEHAVKLRALESINGAFSVVRALRPKTRVPTDTTGLWNTKDLEAAKMERYLMQRMHAERMMWRAAHTRIQRKSQIVLAGSGVVLTVMGLGWLLFRAWVKPRRFELLARDSETA